MTRYLLFWAALPLLAFAAAPPPASLPKADEVPDFVKGADGLEDALRNLRASMVKTPPLTPAQALGKFTASKGHAVDLIGHEPTVKQPLYLQWDARGRMWVVQYRQYPFPAGLKVVAYDRYIRARFDKVPLPPPNHVPGVDRITIHEDEKGDGSFSRVTTFVDGLNIATAALPDQNGVWVLNPPYLLFYPTRPGSDEPGKPVVHLSGFGLEDTHAVASSLCWGPDGWIYGAQGSTCTARIRVERTGAKTTTDFLGQAIWRYHPITFQFEVFAEGGGNTFGVAFDDVGRVYSGTNWGRYRGLHYVQGGYYVKGWGKHGPLTNPYAQGYFEHMPHVGNADRLVHTFVVYGGDTMPELRGKIIGVNALQKRVQVTRLEPDRSTFHTIEEPYLLTTPDERFRPVDVKSGPDGNLYVADLYEPRINHVDPRDNWDRATGRLYRIRPETWSPALPVDLTRKKPTELLALLRHKNLWHREQSRRLLAHASGAGLKVALIALLRDRDHHVALEALWVLHQRGDLDEALLAEALAHTDPHLRRWAVRLIGDGPGNWKNLDPVLVRLAREETDPEVRSQLASSAKRLAGSCGLGILRAMVMRDGKDDNADPHIPLLTWWALEARAESQREEILTWLEDASVWSKQLFARHLAARLVQRWTMAGGADNLAACARLLRQVPSRDQANLVLVALENGFSGRSAGEMPPALQDAIRQAWKHGATGAKLTLGLRLGDPAGTATALALVADEKADEKARLACLRILGEIDRPACVEILLQVLRTSKRGVIRQEVLTALMRYPEARIGDAVLALYPEQLPEADGVRGAAHTLLASRPAWTRALLRAIEAGKINPRSVPLETVQKLALHKEKDLVAQVTKHFGRVRGGSPQEKQREILRVARVVGVARGDALAGKKVFADNCAKCHRLFGEGGEVGPELTGYERTNAMYWMENIVDPSAVIREEYMTFVVQTTDGRTLQGIIAGQDRTTVTLRDQENRITRIDRKRIEDLRASTQSLMPEGQLKALSDAQVRNLFAYLMSKTPPK